MARRIFGTALKLSYCRPHNNIIWPPLVFGVKNEINNKIKLICYPNDSIPLIVLMYMTCGLPSLRVSVSWVFFTTMLHE